MVIDDDPDLVEMLSLTLAMRRPDFRIVTAPDGHAGIRMADTESPRLVNPETCLPDLHGFTVCQEIRHFSDVPVIIVTTQDKRPDIVHELRVGADEYILKPIRPMELLARVQSVLRRADVSSCSSDQKFFQYGELLVDFFHCKVYLGKNQVMLTPIEYQLLYHLTKNTGKVLSHRHLLGRTWGRRYMDETTYLRVHINHLRQKLGDDASDPRFILTDPTVGYKFAKVGPC